MFLYTRLLSGPPAAVLIGLVFAAGFAAGAALRPAIPGVVERSAETAGSSRSERGRSAHDGQPHAQSAPSPWKGEGRGGGQVSAEGRSGNASSLQDLRLAAGGHPAEVLRINDGDTFEARVHVWPGMQVTTKVRLRGIDAAEFRAQCAEEYRLAAAARDALARMLAEGGVTIGRIDFDKYGGRVVANAATRATPDISDALLKTGLVRAYDGGRREGWCGGSLGRS
jgi:endonuclease YncB( thermonuclease family)